MNTENKTMRYLIPAVVVALLAVVGAVGCESAEDHQHHLYNLQQCQAESNLTDVLESDGKFAPTQESHDVHTADCMAGVEHTTVAYQQAKGDDYGKVVKVEPTQDVRACLEKADALVLTSKQIAAGVRVEAVKRCEALVEK